MREMLATDATRTLEERVEYVRHLHYDENQEIFAVAHSSIHKAAADGSVDGIKYFLDSHRRPRIKIDDFDKSGLCPIHCAAKAGMTQCVKYLVDTGCEPDTRSTYGDTALMHACKENKVNVVEQLFNYGIDIKLANTAGFTCIHNAAQADNAESIALLVKLTIDFEAKKKEDEDEDEEDDLASSIVSRRDDDSVSMASYTTDPTENPTVKSFLNLQSRNGTTPLHIACTYNSTKVVNLLIGHRVKLDFKDGMGDTALHKAARQGFYMIYNELKSSGASESITNTFGETAADLLIDNPKF